MGRHLPCVAFHQKIFEYLLRGDGESSSGNYYPKENWTVENNFSISKQLFTRTVLPFLYPDLILCVIKKKTLMSL